MKPWLVIVFFLILWAVKDISGCDTVANASFDTVLGLIEDEDQYRIITDGHWQIESVPGTVGDGALRFDDGGQIYLYTPIFDEDKFEIMFRFKVDENVTDFVQLAQVTPDHWTNHISVFFYQPSKTFLMTVARRFVTCSSRKPASTSEFHGLSLQVEFGGVALNEDGFEICQLTKPVNYPDYPIFGYYVVVGDSEHFNGYMDELVVKQYCDL